MYNSVSNRMIGIHRSIKLSDIIHSYVSRLSIKTKTPYYNFSTSFQKLEISKEYESLDTDIVASSDSDVFGTLRKSMERCISERGPKGLTKNIKVVKVELAKPVAEEANVFGNLSDVKPVWYPDVNEELKEDNDLSDDSIMVKNISKKFRCPKLYLHRMKELVKEKKLKEALDLFVDMRRNFVKPLHPHFTFMIGACGRAGYTEMAFKLLRQMTDRKMCPTAATLTGLFNSCGESPFPELGLKKAHSLKEKIKLKNWTATQPTYHAMIKAFGKCGDMQTAFQIVDEMKIEDIKIDNETYGFLLMSCIADKDAGFTHAVEVWRKMKARKCKPSLFSFNLLLRAARDCNVGPEEISCLLLQHWSSYITRPYGLKTVEITPKEPMLQLPSAEAVQIESETESSPDCNSNMHSAADVKIGPESSVQKQKAKSVVCGINDKTVSILRVRPIDGSEIVDLGSITSSCDRLSLIGGVQGILEEMRKAKVKPDIKTFTLLLNSLPQTTEAEEKLMSLLKTYDVRPDVGFFNILMKRRNYRFDYIGAHNVLMLMNEWSLPPDIVTFGVLALGTKSVQKASNFISEMRKLGYFPNIPIMAILLKNACISVDFQYIEFLLTFMENEHLKPNEQILIKLEETLQNARKNIIHLEHGGQVPKKYTRKDLSTKLKKFSDFYDHWLKRLKFEEEQHVWSQYNTDIYDKVKEEHLDLQTM